MIDYLAGLAATYFGYSTALIAGAPINAGEVATAHGMSCFRTINQRRNGDDLSV